jgi:16S rRNA (uracil1498-N3)-methyltransferase
MRFLVIEPDQLKDVTVRFSREQAHYLKRVLRKNAGDTLEVVLAGQRTLVGRLVSGAREALMLNVHEERPLPPPPRPELTLAMGLIRGPKLEAVARMATEVSTERAVVDWSRGGREERLADIVVSAAQQSGNLYPPTLERYDSVADALARGRTPGSMVVMAIADGGAPISAMAASPDIPVMLFIGPEGDFSDAEVRQAREAGASLVTLNGPVLRAESAALVLATLMLDRMGRFARHHDQLVTVAKREG